MKKNPLRPESQTSAGLRELQRLMANAVMRPLGPGDRMQRKWIDGRLTRRVAESFIKPNARLTSFERLEIYNQQYWFRLGNCLYKDYPGLRAILGDRAFEKLIREYLMRYPSRSYTLRNLGSRLVKFLKTAPGATAPRRQLALDIARLEWAHIEAFDNEARPPLEPNDLLDANAAKLRLRLQPHFSLLKLQYVVDRFLIDLRKKVGLRGEASNAIEQDHHGEKNKLTRNLKRKDNFLAVHCYQDQVYYKRLEPGQFVLLSALQNGATLERACVRLAGLKISEDLGEAIQNWFSDWMALGWFCGLK
ncbi:MAG TPA: DNA-binding domain-containing protein [Verrucomicrobiae bacterium]|nr:DNA-binding domain-containing protein [Verrucomicrobiae bacterium]